MKHLLLSTAMVAGLLSAGTAGAGDCRDSLRPLLLDASPDAARLAEVRDLCRQEAAAGDPDSLYQLALTELGLGGVFEPAVAVPRIRQAAEAGIPEAQYWLAWQSEAGPLLPNDAAAALAWYRRAAEGNHRLALERLATAYEKGELGLSVNEAESLALRARIRRCDE